MKDLNAAELKMLADDIQTVLDDMAHIGLHCIVVVAGRGISRVGYHPDTAPYAPMILESAIKSANAYNAARSN